MMLDTALAILSLLLFLAFLGFLAVYIGELDLWVVILVVAMLATSDFVQSLRNGSNGSSDS